MALLINKKEVLICVGTGFDQMPLIKKAIELGFHIIAFDQSPNYLYKNKNLKLFECSTHDYSKAINLIKFHLNGEKIVGLINRSSGPAAITAANICKEFNIKSISYDLALASARKSRLHYDCKLNNILSPKTYKLDQFIDHDWGNYVIKPDVSMIGKKNVFKPENSSEAKLFFELAKSESFNNNVNLQEYIYGIDLVLFVMCFKGKPINTIIFEELVSLNNNKFEGIGLLIPTDFINLELINKLKSTIKKLIAHWKVEAGFISFSFKIDNNSRPWLYEVNPGLCGDMIISTFLPRALNICANDFYKLDISLSAGIEKNIEFNLQEAICLFNKEILSKEEGLQMIKNSFNTYELNERRNKILGYSVN